VIAPFQMRRRNWLFKLLFIAFALIPLPAGADEELRIRRTPDTLSNANAIAPPKGAIESNPQVRVTVPDSVGNTGLTEVQLRRLAAHDIVLLVDKSGSMGRTDCKLPELGMSSVFTRFSPGPSGEFMSRWNWCLEQTTRMSNQTQQAIPEGFSVLLFDSHYAIYPHVDSKQLVDIFAKNTPIGGTELTAPLVATFEDYFRRKQLAKNKVKPLVVGIITDGGPENPQAVRKVIVSTIFRMHHQSEITVVFFLIGGKVTGGEAFIDYITISAIAAEGAPFNIVKAVSFEELQRIGLARALADNLN
jgi:hypothetical protein